MLSVDLNCDLGEGYGAWQLGHDAALLEIVSSANVACGFHAGDPNIMRDVCRVAAANGVTIGAQVSYHDRVGFGRRFIDIESDDLTNDVIYQIGALSAFASAAGSRVAYVKPHGALYHAVNAHPHQAAAVAAAIRIADSTLAVLCMDDSEFARAAKAEGLHAVREAYADRVYESDGRLRSRRAHGAVIASPDGAIAQARSIVTRRSVNLWNGGTCSVLADSICVHGDTPGAVDLARAVRQGLEDAGVSIEPFVPSGL